LKTYALFSPYIKDSHRDKRARESVHEDEESSSKRHATVASSSPSSPSRPPLAIAASSSSSPPLLSAKGANSEAPTGETGGIDSVDRDVIGTARDSENTEVLVTPQSPEQWSDLLLNPAEQRSPSPDDWFWEEEGEGEEEEDEDKEDEEEVEEEKEGDENDGEEEDIEDKADPEDDDANSGGGFDGAEGEAVGTDGTTASDIHIIPNQRNEEEQGVDGKTHAEDD
jgi:hypothetical protein